MSWASRPVASHPGGGGGVGGSELRWVEHQARIQDFLKGGGGVNTFSDLQISLNELQILLTELEISTIELEI